MGLTPTTLDPEFEIKKDLVTAKTLESVNLGGKETMVDLYHAEVEKTFGKCKLSKHLYTCNGVRHTMQGNHAMTMDQDAYDATICPSVHPELTGAAAEKNATKTVADVFADVRGALTYTTVAQAGTQVYVEALRKVDTPTNLDVRHLNAIMRKLQQKPGKLILKAMTCIKDCDIYTDSGYRHMTEVEDAKGYGVRGPCLLRREVGLDKKQIVHLHRSIYRLHILASKSSYGAEVLTITHGVEDVYYTLMTLVELRQGCFNAKELQAIKEKGGLALKVVRGNLPPHPRVR
jgi:hypothetical protein